MSLIDLYGNRKQQGLTNNDVHDLIEIVGAGEKRGFSLNPDEQFFVKLTAKDTGNTPIRYSWQEVIRNDNNSWVNLTTHSGNATNDPAFEINNANLSIGGNTVYSVTRSQQTGGLLFQTGSSGLLSTDIRGKDIVLMILGTEEEYDTCANAPAASPGCWQGYAWAAYKVCGYTYTKLFDARDMGKWALELNGGTTTAWRRFHPAFWGWDTYTDGLPTTANACEGVRFINSGASALTCECPTWLSDKTCLKIKFTTVARPCNTGTNCGYTCTAFFQTMDDNNAWNKEFSIVLCKTTGCIYAGTDNPFVIDFRWEETPRGEPDCDWGPAIFDPCNPCDGFGRMKLKIGFDVASEVVCDDMESPGWLAYFNLVDLKAVLETSPCGELSAYLSYICNNCVSGTPAGHFNFIDMATVKITCCTANETASC